MTKKEIIELIIEESANSDVDTEFLLTMANIESGFNPNAKNPSGAAGLYQFMPSTAKAYGLRNPYNPTDAIRAVIKLTKANATALQRAGLEPSGANLYLAHQQGAGGVIILYSSILKGRPLSRIIRRNIDANGGKGLSAKEFVDKWKTKYLNKVIEVRELLAELDIFLA